MPDKLVGGDGASLPVAIGPFWVLAMDQAPPDKYVATAIWEIEQKYNPERGEADIQWYASA